MTRKNAYIRELNSSSTTEAIDTIFFFRKQNDSIHFVIPKEEIFCDLNGFIRQTTKVINKTISVLEDGF